MGSTRAIASPTDVPGVQMLVARIAALDARLRSIDPAWAGVQGSFGGMSANAASPNAPALQDTGSFARALAVAGVPGQGGRGTASAMMTVSSGTLVEPLPGARVSQAFGPTTLALEPSAVVDGVRYAHFHDGLDLAAPLGTPVRAAAAGTVIAAGAQADGAVVVRIRHADGSETRYGHLDPDLAVTEGEQVDVGQEIGSVGLTGRTTGPHLHFELVVGGTTVDPAPWLAAGSLPGATNAAPQQPEGAGSPGVATAGADPASASGAAAGSAGVASATTARAFDAISDRIPYADEIRSAAAAAGVDPLLLASLVRAESGFHANAVSPAGALGLTQLMPANVRSMGVGDPFDPASNLAAGARYLANNLRIYGRADLALAAYQAGKGAVARAGGIPDSPTTRNYVNRIIGYWAGYLEQGQEAA